MHNDIKPDNILFDQKDNEKVYLIDFGLASRFQNEKGIHVNKEYYGMFSGNINFASLN